jgi:hypothetical protein
VAGASYTHYISATAYAKFTLAASYAESHSIHNLVIRDSAQNVLSTPQLLGYKGEEIKYTASFFVNKKLSSRHTVKPGFFIHRYQFNMADSIYHNYHGKFLTRLDAHDQAFLFQPYVQWKYRLTDDLEWVAGVHSMHYTLNNNTVVEPRAALKWNFSERQSLGFGAGMHSQLQPSYLHFHQVYQDDRYVRHNRTIGFSRSNHYVLSYDYAFSRSARFKAETYYQQLYDVPVEARSSAYSIINQGVSFQRIFPDSLQNAGSGRNLGIEFTMEKFFSKSFFVLATVSLFESKYKGSDGIERNTDFNGRYVSNFLVGKEFRTTEHAILSLSSKTTAAGGRRYTPVDIEASALANEAVFQDHLTNTLQFRDYFRQDLRISYRINSKRVTHEIALDLINISGTKNIMGLSYAPDPANPLANPMREEYQLGFLPLFYYRIDF